MKAIICCLLVLLLGAGVEAQETKPQETKPQTPKVGRYVHNGKETNVRYSRTAIINYQITSVDVLNEKEMRINFLIGNTHSKQCLVRSQYIKANPFYIVDENYTKYQPLGELKADWGTQTKNKNEYYVLAPTEKVKGYIVFPVIVKGAKKFDLYFGYEAQPIKDIQLIE